MSQKGYRQNQWTLKCCKKDSWFRTPGLEEQTQLWRCLVSLTKQKKSTQIKHFPNPKLANRSREITPREPETTRKGIKWEPWTTWSPTNQGRLPHHLQPWNTPYSSRDSKMGRRSWQKRQDMADGPLCLSVPMWLSLSYLTQSHQSWQAEPT